MNEGRMHDIGTFLLQFTEFFHLFTQRTVGKYIFPFRIHFLSKLFRGNVFQIYFIADLRTQFHHFGNDLIL